MRPTTRRDSCRDFIDANFSLRHFAKRYNMEKKVKKYAILLLFPLLLSCAGENGPAGPDGKTGIDIATVVFQNGVGPTVEYDGCDDAVLDNLLPVDNTGGCDYIKIGSGTGGQVWRSVVRFDLAYIVPSNVTVTGATLDLWLDGSATAAGINTFTAYALTQNWTEGTGACGTSGTADVNVSWDNYNGTGYSWMIAGGDFLSDTVCSSMRINAFAVSKKKTFTLDPALVQLWISAPTQNFGLIIKGEQESGASDDWISWCSGQYTTPGYRPRLTVNYRLP